MIAGLESLLSPFPLKRFFTEHWGQQPLFLDQPQSDFQQLLSIDDVDNILTSRAVQYPAVRLVQHGKPVPISTYTRSVRWGGDSFEALLDADSALSAFERGATIVFQALHLYWPPLTQLCGALEADLHFPIQANAYLTPRQSQGLSAHVDTHDVIVLGTYGTKHWQIALHSSRDTMPIKQAEEIPSEALEEHNSIKRDLREGQLLYIPRGFAHQAVASTEPTLHITIGLKPWSWLDLVTEALKSFSEDEPWLRQRVPLASSGKHELGDEALNKYQQILTKLTARHYFKSGVERLSDRFVTHSTTSLRGSLTEMIQGIQVGPDTKLRMRPGTVASIKTRGESVILRYPSREVTLPAFAAPTIEKILTGESFTCLSLADDLDLDGRLLLAQKLVDQHLLIPDER